MQKILWIGAIMLAVTLAPLSWAQAPACSDIMKNSGRAIDDKYSEQTGHGSLYLNLDCGIMGMHLRIKNRTPQRLSAIFSDAYIATSAGITEIAYQGSSAVEKWNLDTAFALLPANMMPQEQPLYHLVFACSFESELQSWRCGCEGKDCLSPKWSLQTLYERQAETQNPPTTGRLGEIELPPGFGIHYFAKNVVNARSLERGDKGTIFVGNRDGGSVYALVDTNGDFVADEQYVIASGMNQPNGVEFVDGDLFVAEMSRILKYEDIEDNLQNPPEPIVVYDDLPTDRSHGWKYLAQGPDDRLYFGIGAPCNVCLRTDDRRYSSIASIKTDGSDFEIYAEGVRNTIGFDWHPQTGHLWFTENGRDRMGDDIPRDELNSAPVSGLHFGFPICHQGDILDPEFGENEQRSCAEFTSPKINLGPHVAALGMKFYRGDMFPEAYRGDIFIAEHGSWNRTDKIGYRVSHVNIEDSEATTYEPFATGWLQGEQAWGRPVDVLELPDGSLLVSDDFHNAVYRIYYAGSE